MSTEKTIKMPKELLNKWLAALRGGEFKQAGGHLECHLDGDDEGKLGYCCLGVLQKIADGDVQRHDDGSSMSFPTFNWLREHNIEFYSTNDELDNDPLLQWSEDSCYTAAGLNDSETSFTAIADLIEERAEAK